MKARRSLLALALAPLLAASAACSAGVRDGAPATSPESSGTIAQLHQRKCGACHRLVEPASRTRPEIERALGRHEKRLHMTRDEWTAMVDYLAPASVTQAKTAP